MKRVILIHGWGGNPDEAWMPHLKRTLAQRGFEIVAPQMPDTDTPRIASWVAKVTELIGTPGSDTHFVGHSVGCQAIMRAIAALPEGSRVGHVVLVAPWFNLTEEGGKGGAEEKPWLETPIDTDAVRRNTEDITAIFSDDDPLVPLSDAELFRERLDAHIVVEHGMGHMSGDSGITELPSALMSFRK
mgnify:CR=1 FL=1